MLSEIKINGEIYPIDFNMQVIAEFEQETGKDLSDFSGNVSDSTLLTFLAVKDGCDQKDVEFSKSLKEFRRGIGTADFQSIADAISKSMNSGNGEAKKKEIP